MTIRNLIAKVQEEKPNSFSDEKVLSFINEIEIEVAEQMHADTPAYNLEEDMDKDLMALPPYDRLYVSYVKAMIDYANEEYDSYANNQAQHVQDFRDFVDWVVREKVAVRQEIPSRFKNVF